MINRILAWFKRPHDEMAGERHLLTEQQFQDERRTREQFFEGVEDRYYRHLMDGVGQRTDDGK